MNFDYSQAADAAASTMDDTVNSGSKAGDLAGQIDANTVAGWIGDLSGLASNIIKLVGALIK
ncbi:hypothetical protein [uncultured Corynebacterium sp.]|uniref:hypothetical protein n=1 Tax=uncultured Corynebacterium sp. TaxID=159447 RepID=UPI0025FAEB00|nr:hypothetical protein [uncultured Corynebacterium sp.]